MIKKEQFLSDSFSEDKKPKFDFSNVAFASSAPLRDYIFEILGV